MLNRFRECREKTSYSQKQVALIIGVKPPQLSKWESGAALPSRANCEKLSKLYGVSIDYLIGNDEQAKPRQTAIALSESEKLLIIAYRGAEETYKSIALELLEGHQKKTAVSVS